jgi:hypothetical protein
MVTTKVPLRLLLILENTARAILMLSLSLNNRTKLKLILRL